MESSETVKSNQVVEVNRQKSPRFVRTPEGFSDWQGLDASPRRLPHQPRSVNTLNHSLICLMLAACAAHAELRHVENCDSDRLSFFVDTSGDELRLVYKFDGTMMGEVPAFNIDWSWHTKQPEKAIYDVQYCDGGWLFIIYQAGRIAVGEALYQCEYPSGRIKSRERDLDAFCDTLRKDPRMSTFPKSPNRTGYAFLAWIDHDTFLWEVRTKSTSYHVYARFPEGARFDDATQKIAPLKIIEYDRGE